ncbi:mannose-specific lectin 2-like [Phoenix dactylifera]|uniref:Mannose-specific lectin 2-like n=1 Tax=Phoenix dactylifera TaxID=42345 RepID=A0A8B7CFZ6_PHODC|nr:mannose-specific lectin 2-like [Phoenix dactylifera]
MAFPASVPLLILLLTFGLLGRPGSATDFVIYSDPPTALLPGQMFHYDLTPQGIPYGPASLVMQPDCNLVLYFHGEKTWATNTSGLGDNCYLTIDSHGEAILQHNIHYPVWRSNVTSVLGSYAFLLQWNGGLGIYGPAIWSSSNAGELSDPEPSNITTDYVYYSYTVLPIGKILEYKNYKLVLRDDCNLVLLDTNTEEIKWQTNTYSPLHDCFTTLDANGELFVKHNRRDILWRSNVTSTSNLYILVLRYDAKLVIYGPQLWTTKPFW